MAAQRGGLAECSEAVLALVGPLAGVNASVRPQASLRAEESLTLLALPPRPILRLPEHVVEQAGGTGARFPTARHRGFRGPGCKRLLLLLLLLQLCGLVVLLRERRSDGSPHGSVHGHSG